MELENLMEAESYYAFSGGLVLRCLSPWDRSPHDVTPSATVDPESDDYDCGCYPFTGVSSFVGNADHHTVAVIGTGQVVTYDLMKRITSSSPNFGYLYRTGIYDGESHTGYDAVVWFLPLFAQE